MYKRLTRSHESDSQKMLLMLKINNYAQDLRVSINIGLLSVIHRATGRGASPRYEDIEINSRIDFGVRDVLLSIVAGYRDVE